MRGIVIAYNFEDMVIRLLINSLSYDGKSFYAHARSTHGHYWTSLAEIKGSPLGVGGHMDNTNKVEIYDIATNKWTELAPYPYHS